MKAPGVLGFGSTAPPRAMEAISGESFRVHS